MEDNKTIISLIVFTWLLSVFTNIPYIGFFTLFLIVRLLANNTEFIRFLASGDTETVYQAFLNYRKQHEHLGLFSRPAMLPWVMAEKKRIILDEAAKIVRAREANRNL